MQPHLLEENETNGDALVVRHKVGSHFERAWHHHPELELIVVEKSSGTQFVGDNIERFNAGEVVLIGKNLPHMLLNDDIYFEPSSPRIAESFAVYFKMNFLGKDFLEVSETKHITNLLERASRGIKFLEVEEDLLENIRSLKEREPFERLMKFIEVLNALAKHPHYRLLSSMGYVNSFLKTENERLHKIYEYIFKNFKSAIGASDVAEVIGMNSSAFSRFFKQVHQKTFTRYLNEIRIGYACKLLLEDKINITSIAYQSGFKNISNFNRQFKMIVGKSPSSYIRYREHKMESA